MEREFREINQRIEVGARWRDEGVERVVLEGDIKELMANDSVRRAFLG